LTSKWSRAFHEGGIGGRFEGLFEEGNEEADVNWLVACDSGYRIYFIFEPIRNVYSL